jgi:hypothetical protein
MSILGSSMTPSFRTQVEGSISESPTVTEMFLMRFAFQLDANTMTSVLSVFSFNIFSCIQNTMSCRQRSIRCSVSACVTMPVGLKDRYNQRKSGDQVHNVCRWNQLVLCTFCRIWDPALILAAYWILFPLILTWRNLYTMFGDGHWGKMISSLVVCLLFRTHA